MSAIPRSTASLLPGHRGLVPESIWNFRNSPCEFFLDRLGLGDRDPRRQSRAGHRLLKQDLGYLCLIIAQEDNEIIMVAGKGIGATGRDHEFRPSGLPDNHPIAVACDVEHAVRSQLVPADV